MTVSNGGRAFSYSSLPTVIGGYSGNGSVSVTTGGKLDVTGSLDVGYGTTGGGLIGHGSLTIAAGGQVTSNGGMVGGSGATGAVGINGSGSYWLSSGAIYVGEGTLSLGPLALLRATEIDISSSGSFVFTGGTLHLTSGVSELGSLTIPLGGRLMGASTIIGDITNSGTLSPGNSPGQMIIDGNLDGSGKYDMEIGSASLFDQIIVNGGVKFDAASIAMKLLDGYAPQLGQSFKLFSWTDTLEGLWSFDFSGAPLAEGLMWNTDAFASAGTISVEMIPEPASLAIFSIGTLLIVRRSGRRKRQQSSASVGSL